ncbi:SGNH/GDSL hydrolase family protein [Luteimonas saliphila]|uniref:SGNH/GDSL hydrolase family protein n=1 Tax=Luteimonas saliphila TaxID=2804919 RepID=UPI003CCD725B
MKPAAALCSALLPLFALIALPALPGCHSGPQAASAPMDAPAADPVSRDWTADMARSAEEDAAAPPPPRPVVFTGSSSVRLWPALTQDFAGVPVLNRGFGGSEVRDSFWHAEQVASRYRPRQVLIYAGDNDIDAGRTPAQVLSDFQALVERLRRDLPDLRIAYIAIKPSPLRVAQLPLQREANALVRDWAATREGVDFIDVFTPMLDPQGQPDASLFIEDRLHMNAKGYALWRGIVAPYLREK